jgi:diacylglycerol kinase
MPIALASSFRNAFSGISHAIRTQRNARIHLGITLSVLVLGAWLRIGVEDWVPLIVAAGLVWTAELINTALEAAIDLASPQEHSLAKVSKDVSAGAVLLAAVTAAVVGILILGPPLLARIIP